MRRHQLIGFLVLGLVSMLGGCSCRCRLIVQPVDKRADSMSFRVSTKGKACEYSRVESITVFTDNPYTELWRLKGPDKPLSSFTYGVVPPGFSEEVAAKPLAPGQEIHVSLVGGGGAYGGRVT